MESNKRLLLAIALSVVVLVGWHFLFPPLGAQNKANDPSQQSQAQQNAQPAKSQAKPDANMAAAEPLAGVPITVTTPMYKAVINSSGAVFEQFSLTHYKQSMAADSPNMNLITQQALSKAPLGLIVDGKASWRDATWTTDAKDTALSSGQSVTLTFTGQLGQITIVRKLTFHADTYIIDETVRLSSPTPTTAKVAFTLASTTLTSHEDKYNTTRAAYLEGKSLETITDPDKIKDGKVIPSGGKWAAVESNYFIVAVLPGAECALKFQYVDDVYRLAAERDGISVTPEGTETASAYYLGPKTRESLSLAPDNLKAALDYGWFHVVAEVLLWLLHYLYGYVHNYGVAIIILTVIIKGLFWPLSQKSYKSMEKMRKLQPMMAAIREKYGDDRNKMNEELMQLYKTYKVNPAGGCLPMLVQLPVFFGLYQALLNAIELRHASFITYLPFTHHIWLADLSAKDPYYITPLVMGATMFLQQKMTPAPGDPTQAKIMMFMPVIFTFMFLNFPSGLVIYWLVNNVLSIAQQWLLMRSGKTPAAPKA
ncbi:membrane protein insertase YidC [Fundidesulfovibrio butyratiphilus]